MSSIQIQKLQKIIADAQSALAALELAPKGAKEAKEAKVKKPSKATGQSTVWASWTKKMLNEEWPAVKDAFTEARLSKAAAGELLYTGEEAVCKRGKHSAGDAYSVEEAKIGVHIAWISAHKKAHAAEYAAFEAEWKAANPRTAKDSDSESVSAPVAGAGAGAGASASASESDGEAKEKKRGRKKLSDMTAEERAKHDASVLSRREVKKAKAAPEPAQQDAKVAEDLSKELVEAEEVIFPTISVASVAPSASALPAPASPARSPSPKVKGD